MYKSRPPTSTHTVERFGGVFLMSFSKSKLNIFVPFLFSLDGLLLLGQGVHWPWKLSLLTHGFRVTGNSWIPCQSHGFASSFSFSVFLFERVFQILAVLFGSDCIYFMALYKFMCVLKRRDEAGDWGVVGFFFFLFSVGCVLVSWCNNSRHLHDFDIFISNVGLMDKNQTFSFQKMNKTNNKNLTMFSCLAIHAPLLFAVLPFAE